MSNDTFAYVSGVLVPMGTTESAVRSLWEEFLEFGAVDHRDPVHPRCTEYDIRPARLYVRVQRRDRTGALVGTTLHPNLLSTKWWSLPQLSSCHELLTDIALIPIEEMGETT